MTFYSGEKMTIHAMSNCEVILLILFLFFKTFMGLKSNTMHVMQGLVNNLISAGLGREAAFSAALLGDNVLMEKAWHDTGMLAEAVLHAHVRAVPTLFTG